MTEAAFQPSDSSAPRPARRHITPPWSQRALDLMIDGAIREMVLAKRSAHEIRHQALMSVNLFALQEDGIAKALLGWTTLEQVIRQAPRITEQRTLDEIATRAFQEA